MRAQGHHYALFLILLAIAHVSVACTSFRAAAKCLGLWSEFLALTSPCVNSIRQWSQRLGLYLLQQVEKRQDWLWVVDMSVELGAAKCLVVLGISEVEWQQHLEDGGGGLHHQQMTVLAIEVLQTSNGCVIEQTLLSLGQRLGEPKQIVCDHGSDLYKGVRLYCESIDGLIHTYDVTHALAILLKGTLADDEQFQSFLKSVHQTRQQLQQTSMAFLMPPAQRSKCRYLNLAPLLVWAQHLLDYEQRGDFSAINPRYCCELEALGQLRLDSCVPSEIIQQLLPIKDIVYDNQVEFEQQLSQMLDPQAFEQYAQPILQAADLGRRQFEQKLGWLVERQVQIEQYGQLLTLINSANEQLKVEGLTCESEQQFRQASESLNLDEQGQKVRQQVLEYIEQQAQPLTLGQAVLASSDVIESIFGKYKLWSQHSPLKEVGRLILMIPLCTVKLTLPLLKQALETVCSLDVERWADEVIGVSALAQRRQLFKRHQDDTEVA